MDKTGIAPVTFNWNVVTRHRHVDEALRRELRTKIARLEPHLRHFPPEAVHLQIVLEGHSRKRESTATLTLRIPSNLLQASRSTDDVGASVDLALQGLLHDLELFNAALRNEQLRTRQEQPEPSLTTTSFTQEPQAEGSGPLEFRDMVRELLHYHYKQLLRHARRDIRYEELSGGIPGNALEAREIVDEAVRRVLARATRKPKDMGWMTWFYHLIHDELKRQRQLLKNEQAVEVALESRAALPELDEQRLHPLEEIVEEQLEPEIIRFEDIVPSSDTVPPDEFAAEKDALENLVREMKSWPRVEREVFELHYVEGLAAEEIAQVTRHPVQQVTEILTILHQRLPRALVEDMPV